MSELFPVEDPNPGMNRTQKVIRANLARGIHPVGGLVQPDRQETCGSCVHRFIRSYRNKRYPKCDISHVSHGVGTDVRAWWPACTRWEAKP